MKEIDMTKITNIGKKDRMVADRILRPGESKEITPKQAELLEGDQDFEIKEDAPPQAQPEVDPFSDASTVTGGLDTAVSTQPTRPAKVGRRGKKKS
jgi:hypothetical protein